MLNIKYKNYGNGITPKYMTAGAVGADLYSPETIELHSKDVVLVDTCISIEIPEGYEGEIRPRSSLLPKRGILGIHGTVDQDYRGTLKVVLMNVSEGTTKIEAGERIAQLVISPVEKAYFIEEELSETERGDQGFGSTGR